MSFTFERVAIVGAPGTGKSYTLGRLFEECLDARAAAGLRSREVIFDPMGEWNRKGAVRVATRRDFLRALETDRFPIVVEGTFEDWTPLDVFTDLVLLGDELHNFHTPHAIHPSQRRLFCESRKRRCSIFVATQRVNHMNPVVLSTATRAYILPVQHREDRRAVETGLGITLPPAGAWRKVPGHEGERWRLPFIWPDDFDESGCVSLGGAPK